MKIALHKHYIIGVSQFYFSLKLNGLTPEVWGKYITVEISEEHMAYLKLTAPELMNKPWYIFDEEFATYYTDKALFTVNGVCVALPENT